MKKILSVMTAAVMLVVTLTGCAAFRLSESEYKEQAAELIDEYLYLVLDDGGSTADMTEFDKDVLADVKEDVEEILKEADEYLDKLEKLNPPEEMEDFHDDLLFCIEKARDLEAEMLEVLESNTEEKYMERSEKMSSSFEKLLKKIQKLTEDEDNDWLLDELEDGKFMESSTVVNMKKKAQVTSADMTAKSLDDVVMMWITTLDTYGYRIPVETFVITVNGHSENVEWIGDVSVPKFTIRNSGYSVGDLAEHFKKSLGDQLNVEKDISAVIWISERRVAGCACSTDLSTAELEQMFTAEDFNSGSGYLGYYEWTGKIDGMTKQGDIVGTSPKLMMNNQ